MHNTNRRLRWAIAAAAAIAALAVAIWQTRDEVPGQGRTIGEKLTSLRAERASLQARADGEARIALVREFRIASLLSDALAVRSDPDRQRDLERLSSPQRQALVEVEALNAALGQALARPGEGARLAARAASERAQAALERLADIDSAPLVLLVTPRFVPPRRGTGELTLTPRPRAVPPPGGALQLDTTTKTVGEPVARPNGPTVPRYAPSFAAAGDDDPPITVEVTGLHLVPDDGSSPVLTIGTWRGAATLAPERLRFVVPRSAFAAEATRTTFATASLSIRRASRPSTFELLFVVLPDRPGSFALDQRVRTTVPEANTLVSPEILVRAGAGETRTRRRCFDPPAGWRFDKARRHVVIVERLGWLDDVSDATVNGGSVEFAADEEPEQICLLVTARPATRAARTATIGRFEATLVHDKVEDRTEKSGVRALDWHEAVRLPIDPNAAEWKVYIRLFDEIDREFSSTAQAVVPFLHITRDANGKTIVLQADPTAEP